MEYQNAPKGGKIAIRLDEDDELIRVKLTDGTQDLFIGTHLGKMIRFNESDVRDMGRVSRGVRGILLEDGDLCGWNEHLPGGRENAGGQRKGIRQEDRAV